MEQPARPRRRTAVGAACVVGVAGAVVLVTSGALAWGLLRAVVALAVGGGVAIAQRSGTHVAGWSAVVLGTVVLPSVGPIAVDHLAAGAVLRGGAALATALGAGTLLVCGTGTLLRAVHGWWRLLALPVAFLLLQLVVYPIAMAVLPTNRAHADLGSATPADHGLAYEDVTVPAPGGVGLAAWWLPGESRAAVVLLHGSGSTRTAALDHAAALAHLGYGVLMLDARGHGESGGTAMDLGWYGAPDVSAAVDWLAARPDVDAGRIGAVGLSMGGEEGLTAAAADPRIHAVVAEGVGVRVAADAPPEGWFPDGVNRLVTSLTDLLTTAAPPPPLRDVIAVLHDAGTPALLIAGAGEGEQAAWLTRGSDAGVVGVWDVPDAAHTRALATHPDAWSSRVQTVLAAGLGPA